MAEASVEDRLKNLIARRLFLKIAPDSIDVNKSLTDVYGIDSVSLLELVVGVEEEFGVTIPDEEFSLKHFETVAALAAFVRGKLGAG